MGWLDRFRRRKAERTASPRLTGQLPVASTSPDQTRSGDPRGAPHDPFTIPASLPPSTPVPSSGEPETNTRSAIAPTSQDAAGLALKAATLFTPTPASPIAAPRFAVGDLIAKSYEVTRVISDGGGTSVFLARHHELDLDVVVKVPDVKLASDPEALRAFKSGAASWMSLGLHPHVAYCHGVHPLDHLPLLVAEYIERGNLRDWLAERQRPSLRTSLDLAIQFCHGLEHAHSRGLIHRALKPENVLLTGDGILKLTDFGIAASRPTSKATSGANEAALATNRPLPSAYLAPEQWGDVAGDTRADIFAMGLMLYELLCGRRPYDLTRGPRQEPPDPRALYEDTWGDTWEDRLLPARLCKLVRRCVDWDREQRPWSVTEVRQELTAIYATTFDETSPFAELPAGSPEADGWNNRALAHLMLDQPKEADDAWEAALAADRHHLEAIFNRGLTRWRRGEVTDQVLLEQLQQLQPPTDAQWRLKHLRALVHLERGAVDAALPLLEESSRLAPDEADVAAALTRLRAGDFASAECVGVIEGHSNYVTAVALSTDGRLAVSSSHDHSLRVWDVPTGRCLRVLEGHRHHVLAVAMTGDARLAVSGADEEPLRLWEVASGRCLRVFEGGAGRPYGVALSGDGRLALSTGAEGTAGPDVGAVQLWDADTGRRRIVFNGHTSHVKAIAITPDGRWALSGSDDRTARMWDVATGRCLQVLEGHEHHVSAVYISPNAQWAVTGGWDESVRLWDLTTGRCKRTFVGHPSLVTAVHVLPEAHRVLSGSWDRTVRLWDTETGRCLRTFEGHRGMVTAVHLLAGGRRVLSASWDMSLRLWQSPDATPPDLCRVRPARPATYAAAHGAQSLPARDLLEQANHALNDARYTSALECLRELRGGNGNGLSPQVRTAWRQLSRYCHRTGLHTALPAPTLTEPDVICCTALSADGRWIVVGSRDHSVRLWEAATGQCLQTWEGHTDRVSCVQLSRDDRWMLSGSADRTVRLWDVDAGVCQRIFTGHTSLVTSVGLSATGRWALSGSYDHTVRLWEVATGRCTRIFTGHTRQVSAVALSADGRFALSGAYDRTLRLWDLATGQCLREFEGHQRAVSSIQLSSDSTIALSGSDDGTVRIWETATGRCLHIFEGHTDAVTAVRLSLDGRWAVSAGHDRSVRVWDLRAQRGHAMLEGIGGAVRSVSLSDDTCWLLIGGEDKSLRRWELDWELEALDAVDWDEGARPHLTTFLTLHPPLRLDPGAPDTANGRAAPSWNEQDFQQLLSSLQCAGYGWLRPDGVRRELTALLETWDVSGRIV